MADAPPSSHLGSPHSRGLDDLYTSPPPWDINRPQPALLALAEAGVITGRVLDVGCGTGEHTLMAARLGTDATGVDLAATAIAIASAKAEQRGLSARFLRHDALRLGDLGETFDTVLDSLVFHGFTRDDRTAYVGGLRAAVRPGGRYFMLCFRDEPPTPSGRTHRVTPDEIRTAFSDGWRIDAIDDVTIDSALPTLQHGIRGWRTALTRI